ncbi:Gfo/Idh/MocA family protein [Labrys neptuniae]
MRIALAGVGHWHASMQREAAHHAGATVAGVWDEDADIAARFALENGIQAYLSFEAVVAARPDLVVLMGRPAGLVERALALVDAGLPVLLEKPAALKASELEPLRDRGRHGAFIAVPLPNRCSPIWARMTELAASDRLGRLSHAQFRLVNGPPERYRIDGVPWLLAPQTSGGGALRNLGIHGIDAALALAGDSDLELVSASLGHLHGEAVEDYAVVTLRSHQGLIVTVEAGYTYASMAAGGDFEWRVSSANAYLVDRGDHCRITTLDDEVTREEPPFPPGERYRAFMADTLGRLSRGEAPLVGIEDYWRAMAMIDEAYGTAMA